MTTIYGLAVMPLDSLLRVEGVLLNGKREASQTSKIALNSAFESPYLRNNSPSSARKRPRISD